MGQQNKGILKKTHPNRMEEFLRHGVITESIK